MPCLQQCNIRGILGVGIIATTAVPRPGINGYHDSQHRNQSISELSRTECHYFTSPTLCKNTANNLITRGRNCANKTTQSARCPVHPAAYTLGTSAVPSAARGTTLQATRCARYGSSQHTTSQHKHMPHIYLHLYKLHHSVYNGENWQHHHVTCLQFRSDKSRRHFKLDARPD